MLISLRWISDYVTLPPLRLREVVEALTLGTAEVEEVWLWDLKKGERISRPLGEETFATLETNTDLIIEIDNKSLTHRPDLWGHYGFAREFAALFRSKLNDTFSMEWRTTLEKRFSDDNSPLKPTFDPASACLGYCGLSMDGVVAEASPDWMQQRLLAVGLRPVNTLVDIGNYVMLEVGIPLHIFDREKIQENIHVRELDASCEMVLLDGSTVTLEPGDSVVGDSSGPLVIGGIMGGESSAVSDTTSRLFIECANWEASRIRKTSARIGVRTDSSLRYEKTLDTALLDRTVLRAAELMSRLHSNARIVGRLEYAPGGKYKPEPLQITLSHGTIEKVLGIELERRTVVEILSALSFTITESGQDYLVKVPSFRATKDVSCAEDLIEELGRIIGYNNIPDKAPLFPVEGHGLTPSQRLVRDAQDFLVANARASEIMSYPLVGEDLLDRAGWPVKNSELLLKNAWSSAYDRMRPSLVPSLLEKVASNQKSYDDFQFFEIGRSYRSSPSDFRDESQELAICLFGRRDNRFVELLEIVERVVPYLTKRCCELSGGIESGNPYLPLEWKGNHPYHSMTIRIDGVAVGAVTEVTPSVLRNFKIRGRTAVALLSLAGLLEATREKAVLFQPIPQFPAATFDATVVVACGEAVGGTLVSDEAETPREIRSRKIRSVFPLPGGEQAVTVRSVFLDPQRTLSAERLKELENWVLDDLAKRGYPLKEG